MTKDGNIHSSTLVMLQLRTTSSLKKGDVVKDGGNADTLLEIGPGERSKIFSNLDFAQQHTKSLNSSYSLKVNMCL